MVLSNKKCVVYNCSSLSFCRKFGFPKNVSQGFLWVNMVKNEELNKLLYREIVRNSYFVCHKHFVADAFSLSEEEVQRSFFPCVNLFNSDELSKRRRRRETFDHSKRDEKIKKKRRLFSSDSAESSAFSSSASDDSLAISLTSPKSSWPKHFSPLGYTLPKHKVVESEGKTMSRFFLLELSLYMNEFKNLLLWKNTFVESILKIIFGIVAVHLPSGKNKN